MLGGADDDGPKNQGKISRREALKGVATIGATALGPGALGCSSDEDAGEGEGELGPETLFQHGVASGDPLPNGVILWTRVSPQREGPVTVSWTVARDPELRQVVASGRIDATEERDFTVKVDASGLEPGTTYYYRFRALRRESPIGRTRTAPAGAVDRLRFGVVSCSSLAHGFFHAYRAVAERSDLDAVIHLGDYIYEYASGAYGERREYVPLTELLTLADYRLRHAQYKSDPDLVEAHRQHPFICIWDDHETADNSWKDGAVNHTPGEEGDWAARKAAGIQAYMEWLPIRESEPNRIFRKLSYGDLVDLVLLDTRLWGRNTPDQGLVGAPPAEDPSRTLLGDDQAAWLEDQLRTSTARWKLIGQQVMVASLVLEPNASLVNLDQWHGFPESRRRLLEFLRDTPVNDVVVLTGDIHSSWANELVLDPNFYDEGRASVAVEFVTPAITSPGIPDLFLGVIETARPFNPWVRWVEPTSRGYFVLDVTAERAQAAWYLRQDVESETPAGEQLGKVWSVRAGEKVLSEDAEPAPPPANAPTPAPVA